MADAYSDVPGMGSGSGGNGSGWPGGGAGSNATTGMFGTSPGMTDPQQSAFSYMAALLSEYGLSSLSTVLKELVLDGTTDPSQLTLALQGTNEWKLRFAGNERLRQAGLPVLSVAEYLSVERSYAQVMKNYGLPTGFYDDPADFADFIGNSVSPNELTQRVQIAADITNREDPSIVAQLQSMGMTKGDLIANAIDPSRALPLIQKKYQTALLGGAARRAGTVANNDYLGKLAELGITEQQAGQGYGMISAGLVGMERLGAIYGEQFGMQDFEREIFENDGEAATKRKRLASRERASFQGQSGVGQGSLSKSSGGSF